MTEQVKKLMKTLNVSEQEAMEILNADREIDRGAKLYSLDKEAEKESKKARQCDRKKPMICKSDSSKKKNPANESKSAIISNVISALEQMDATEITIANPEREFTFKMGDVKYKFVLSVPRG